MKRLLALILVISSCGKIPEVSSNYYLTKTDIRVDVTRSVTCNSLDELVVLNSVAPILTNSADTTSQHVLDFQQFSGPFSDPDVKVQFFEDGRLKSLNSTQTGTAKQVVESVLTVVAAGRSRILDKEDGEEFNACKYIEDKKNKNTGLLTLQYSKELTVPSTNIQEIKPVDGSLVHHLKLEKHLGNLFTRISAANYSRLKHPVDNNNEDQTNVLIARQLTRVNFAVQSDLKGEKIWEGAALMALPGNEYGIPIPRKAAFGSQELVIEFADSGSLETLRYAAKSGAGDAGALASAVIDEAQGSTVTEQANELKAEADLIKQRHRLTVCQADPSKCP
ncbi:hypothetical protein [Ruegeria arenilitoris]|uniref:hypothetical protein n=1 Tax=Ruegeria arenilitoris TaxID=1173585 RepID=UPI001CFE1379|nr:hypothetical protein [Ruegeria arenilitoris]